MAQPKIDADQLDIQEYATLLSPALTGNPTAPTQTSGNNSTRIATTAFVQDALSGGAGTGDNIAGIGWTTLASGLIIQWGTGVTAPYPSGFLYVTFPIAFPTSCTSFVATSDIGANGGTSTFTSGVSTAGGGIYSYSTAGGWYPRGVTTRWIAIGY